MVIFCVYTRERAKKPPNSEVYTRIEKKPLHNLRTIQKKMFATVLEPIRIRIRSKKSQPKAGI